MAAYLYKWKGDVSVHILGEDAPASNAQASIVVYPDRVWTGSLELHEGASRPSSSWVFTTEKGGVHAFRVVGGSGRSVAIEAFNAAIPPPGRQLVRSAEGSVMIGVHGQWVDRALATVEVFNDDTWTAVLRLEGSGIYEVAGQQVVLRTGDRFDLQADRDGAVPVVARIHEISMGYSPDAVAATLVVVGSPDSAPPL